MTDDPSEPTLPRAYLRAVLLLLVASGPAHGYDLLDQVRAAGMRMTDPGGLYRTLRSLEQQKVLDSWWEDSPTGPPRRTYVLTPAGQEALAEEMQNMRDIVGLLSTLLERGEEVLGSIRR